MYWCRTQPEFPFGRFQLISRNEGGWGKGLMFKKKKKRAVFKIKKLLFNVSGTLLNRNSMAKVPTVKYLN
jgi:hypothetical protein